jgi:hypothetical protein
MAMDFEARLGKLRDELDRREAAGPEEKIDAADLWRSRRSRMAGRTAGGRSITSCHDGWRVC